MLYKQSYSYRSLLPGTQQQCITLQRSEILFFLFFILRVKSIEKLKTNVRPGCNAASLSLAAP